MKQIKWMALGIILWSAGSVAQAQLVGNQIFIPQEGSISGSLLNKETGAPVRDCQIVLHRIMLEKTTFSPELFGMDSTPQLLTATAMIGNRSTYSDAQGAFSFTNLRTGDHYYELEIQSPIYQQQIVSGNFSVGTNDWGIIEVSARPFYVHRSSPIPYTTDPSVVRTTVVNTTGKRAYMRFWLTGKLERRDDSEYYGCSSEVPLKLQKRHKRGHKNYATYRLVPGENEIELNVKDYGPDIVVSQIMINGGRSYTEPLMMSQPVIRFDNVVTLSPGGHLYRDPIYFNPINPGILNPGSSSSGTLYVNSGSSASFEVSSDLIVGSVDSSNTLIIDGAVSGLTLNSTNIIIQSDSASVSVAPDLVIGNYSELVAP